jgi:PAS domain S-box-containing protein
MLGNHCREILRKERQMHISKRAGFILTILISLVLLVSCQVDAEKKTVSFTLVELSIVVFFALIVIIAMVIYHVLKVNLMKKKSLFYFDERRLLRTIIDNMPDFIYLKDTRSRFVVVNKFVSEMTNAESPSSMIGKTDFDYYPKELARKYYEDEQKLIRTKKPLINLEEEGLDKKGRKIIIASTKMPWIDKDGTVLGVVGIGRNITKIKDIEKKLLEQTEHLRQVNVLLEEKHEHINQQAEELSAQTDSLKELNLELLKINETKDKFIAIIAHDLRNPFNAIINFSELLIIKAEDTMKPKQMEMVKIINSSSKMAYSLLENLLYWAKNENATVQYYPSQLDLSEIVRGVVEFHEVSARLKNINLINSTPSAVFVEGDQNMITTVLRNLLSNAVKFTPKNGTVTVSTEVTPEHTLVTVTDTGIGMTAEQLKKLFTADMEVVKGTSGESGTGLGLKLCQEFARINGGDILVKSEFRRGSSFILSLPSQAND